MVSATIQLGKLYLNLTERYYGVSITPVDYKNATEKARTQINKWVSDKTENKINDILQPGILNSYTRLVLVNAIYFNGKWANPFKNRMTKDTPFHLSASDSVNVPMMNQTSYFNYAETDDLQILEASYIGNNLSMLILLPKKIDGLEQLESRLSLENLRNWRKSLKGKEVIVYLPKFRMTSQFELEKVLPQMGMTDAFDKEKADFSGINGKNCKNNDRDCLLISAVIHKAYIDVDEKGTEAAAATAIIMADGSGAMRPSSPPVFRADHPFLLLIQENITGSILFMGRVTDPSKSGE